jgi:broad specificity polyphosphatase/5'/3'-nucleotidase SurE
LVERFRTDPAFRELMSRPEEGKPLVLNVNFPTCSEGTRRGLRVVPIGPVARVIGYELIGEEDGIRTYEPIRETRNAFASDCTSVLEGPIDDVEAMTNGFASVTPLNTDLTAVGSLDDFLFLEE